MLRNMVFLLLTPLTLIIIYGQPIILVVKLTCYIKGKLKKQKTMALVEYLVVIPINIKLKTYQLTKI